MSRDFTEAKAEIEVQKRAFIICDACKVDPFKCSFRYGNVKRCKKLANKIYEDTDNDDYE